MVRKNPRIRIRVLILDRQVMFAEALRAALGAQRDMVVVGVVHGADDAASAAADAGPQVVLADLGLPGDAGIDVVRRLAVARPIPRPAPVTTATLPSRRDKGFLLRPRAGSRGAPGLPTEVSGRSGNATRAIRPPSTHGLGGMLEAAGPCP